MINYVGRPIPNSTLFFNTATFEEFAGWISKLYIYQLDTETNVVNSIVERKLKLIQFGDSHGVDQWVLDPRVLTNSQAKQLQDILNNPLQIKIAHNASFEYTILKKYGITLSNIYDTMLAEKVIWCGYSVEPGFYSLAGLTKRYLYKELDKGLQTSFDVDTFSVEQIYYAANDVKDLGGIRRLQITSAREANLLNVIALENESVCGFSEIEFNGMRLDIDAWRANIDLADPIIEEAARKLDEFLRSEEFREEAIARGYLTDKDTLAINWNSTLQKKQILNYIFPDLVGITKPTLTKYLKYLEHKYNDQWPDYLLLKALLDKDLDYVNSKILQWYPDWLLENKLLIPADTSTISWTSGKQALGVLQIIYPKLKSVSKEALSDCDHPIIEAYHDFLNTTKLKTTYGEKFIEEHVDSDGRVRTNFNQVLNTGRVSSSKPNIQNIPAKESVGNRYRNAFIADEGWKFVDSDYKSQEAVLVASFSGDEVWMNAIIKEQDLHSVCAEVVFQDKWKEAAESTCDYYKVVDGIQLKQKCKCKKHKTLRTLVKTINFGLVYGMSKYKLSATAKVSLEEAQETIDRYFLAFPGIAGILNAFGAYGVRNGFIMTSKPFLRRRYYDYWDGNQHDRKMMGKIERASKNMPFQGELLPWLNPVNSVNSVILNTEPSY
jgi:DNA polymerase I-like protein with 3'-5' exonuclease and polymerase domains